MSVIVPDGWKASRNAQRARDSIAAIANAKIDEVRPFPLLAQVQSIGSGKCIVQSVQDNSEITAFFTVNVQPSAINQLVRVANLRGQYWVIEVVSGPEAKVNTNLIDPLVFSPTHQTELRMGVALDLPASGFTTHGGRYETTDVIWGVVALVELTVIQTVNSAVIQTFKFPVTPTVNAWTSVYPDVDSGVYNTNDLIVEAMTDATGFEFRVRNLAQGSPTPGGYYVDVKIIGSGWHQAIAPEGIEASSTAPTLWPALGNDTGWGQASTMASWFAPTGWTLTALRFRVRNKVAELRASMTRSGANIVATAAGNVHGGDVTDANILNVPSNVYPHSGEIVAQGSSGNGSGSIHLGTSGSWYISDWLPGATIATGDIIDWSAMWFPIGF